MMIMMSLVAPCGPHQAMQYEYKPEKFPECCCKLNKKKRKREKKEGVLVIKMP